MRKIITLTTLLGLTALALLVGVREAHSFIRGGEWYKTTPNSNMADPAFVQYLKEIGFTEELISKWTADKSNFILWTDKNATHAEVFYEHSAMYSNRFVFQSGVEFLSNILDYTRKPQTITIGPDGEWTRVIKMDGFESHQVAKFHPEGIKVTLKAKGAEAQLEFVKFKPRG